MMMSEKPPLFRKARAGKKKVSEALCGFLAHHHSYYLKSCNCKSLYFQIKKERGNGNGLPVSFSLSHTRTMDRMGSVISH
jgi:hypothetical protein